jgi:hypothetical protein
MKIKVIDILLSVTLIVISVFYFKDAKRLVFKFANPDEINYYDHKFDIVKERLPKRGIIGYASDTDQHLALMRLYYAQYALTPLIVLDEKNMEYVVCDFSDADKFDILVKDGKFEIVSRIKDGIGLLRRK